MRWSYWPHWPAVPRPQYQTGKCDWKIKIFEIKLIVLLRAGGPAWPASEAELLEIPSVEEGTVVPPPPTPPPRPSTASTHYTQTTD